MNLRTQLRQSKIIALKSGNSYCKFIKSNPPPKQKENKISYMALKTDDCDIRDVRFYMDHGGNGDYYFNLVEYEIDGCLKAINMRFAMSGGHAPHEIKMAIANLYRLMEKAGLNNHPKDDPIT
jgi:hypothetical protein